MDAYWQWEQDPVVVLGYGSQLPDTLDSRREGYQHQAQAMHHAPRWTVYDLTVSPARPVGTTTLRVDHPRRVAEFFILLGAAGRGRGLGSEATRLTLDWAFHLAALRSVELRVLAPHAVAVRAYEKAGFRLAGHRRRAGFWLGQSATN